MPFGLLVKKFGRFTKTALYVSRGDFRRKKSFELKSFFSISFWLWSGDFHDFGKNWRKCRQSCILSVQTNLLQKKFWRKWIQHYQIFRKKISEFRWKFVGICSSNLPSKCPKEISGEQSLHKKVNSNHFLLLAEKVSNFSSKVPSSAVKTAFNVSGGWNPGKKMFLEVQNSPIFPDFEKKFSDCER